MDGLPGGDALLALLLLLLLPALLPFPAGPGPGEGEPLLLGGLPGRRLVEAGFAARVEGVDRGGCRRMALGLIEAAGGGGERGRGHDAPEAIAEGHGAGCRWWYWWRRRR